MNIYTNFFRNAWKSTGLMALMGCLLLGASCSDDEPAVDPVDPPTASFSTGTIDGLTVSFVDASIGAESYAWDFGDNSGTSTESDPTYTYAEAGTYTVTLTVTNASGTDDTESELTVTIPVFANFIVDKTWIPVREDYVAYHLGPDDDSWAFELQTGAPWFNIGDLQDEAGEFVLQASLANRPSMANDEYTFNEDGTYNINWNGDFWGEFGIWAGTDYNEVDIDIVDGALPLRADGVDVSDFVKETQNYVIDEVAGTIQVIGSGAHIHNPRYKDDESSYDVGEGITYKIFMIEEGADFDILVLEGQVFDNDFSSANRHYFTYAYYKNSTPTIRDNDGFVETDYAEEISSSTMSHSFSAEDGMGSGVDDVTSSSIVEYGVEQDGVTATKVTRTDADGGFTDFKLWSRDADIRFDDNGTYDHSVAKIDVYIPSSNTFADGGLQNQVTIKLADESGDDDGAEGGPGFWCCWVTLDVTDIALDEWVSLEFDFTGMLDDEAAASGVRDDIDLVIIEFGGSGHPNAGEIYYSNFRFEQQ